MAMTKPVEELSGREKTTLISRITTKAVIVLLVLAIVAAIQMFRLGVSGRYILLMAGSPLSIVALFLYANRIFFVDPATRRAERNGLKAIGFAIVGLVPYLFGCYLVFYEGLWRLRLLLEGFSVGVLVVVLLYVVGGYAVVSAIYNVTEYGRASHTRSEHR